MTSRTRMETIGLNHGTWTSGSTIREYNSEFSKRKCIDVPDNFGGENDFTLTVWDTIVGLMNGTVGTCTFKDVPLTLYGCASHADVAPTPASFYTQIVANTSPSAPSLPILVSLFELKDLKRSIISDLENVKSLFRRSSFSSKRRAVSDLFLSKEMGWRPLISDIRKLIDIQSSTSRRLSELATLSTGGVLRKQCHLQTITTEGEWSPLKTQHSALACYVTVKYRDRTRREVWGSAKWEPSNSFPKSFLYLNDAEKYRFAFRSALGLHVDQLPYSLWQALPWSWLIDWFDATSDMLIASNNTVAHVSNGKCCVMQHATTRREYQVISKPPDITISRHFSTYESKSRRVTSGPCQEAKAPFLSRRRLSVLAALISQRVK